MKKIDIHREFALKGALIRSARDAIKREERELLDELRLHSPDVMRYCKRFIAEEIDWGALLKSQSLCLEEKERIVLVAQGRAIREMQEFAERLTSHLDILAVWCYQHEVDRKTLFATLRDKGISGTWVYLKGSTARFKGEFLAGILAYLVETKVIGIRIEVKFGGKK